MHGKDANIIYKGKHYKFMVMCQPEDSEEYVNDVGRRKLENLEQLHSELTIDEIVKKINQGLLWVYKVRVLLKVRRMRFEETL